MENEQIQCIGCGAIIQTEDKSKIGYLPEGAFKKGLESGEFYCQRCFRLRHYNELSDLSLSDDIFLEKLSSIAEDDAFVIYLIDIFDVEGSLIHGLSRFINHQPFIVFVNKLDLLPKSIKVNRIEQWIYKTLKQNGLFPKDVILGSANKGHTLDSLRKIIEKEVQNRNVYIVGVTNVGKSTLINHLIEYYGGDKEVITTSNHPGTTLDLIEIPLNEKYSIIDTPGIIHRNQLAHYLNRAEIKQLLPEKPIKPTVFQLNSGQTIFIGGVARIDFIAGPRASFTYYVSNQAYLHRTKTEQADNFYEKHVGELLQPPTKENLAAFPELTSRTIKLKADQDLAISGLGWLTANEDVELVIWYPKEVAIVIRQSII